MEAEAASQAVVPHGLVRLTAPMSFGVAHVAPILPDLFLAYPQISVDLHLSPTRSWIWSAAGSTWLMRIAALADSSLRARRIRRSAACSWVLAALLRAPGPPGPPRDPRGHACLGYAYLPTPDRWHFSGAPRARTSAVKPKRPASR